MEYKFSIVVPEDYKGDIVPLSQCLPHEFTDYVCGYEGDIPAAVYSLWFEYKTGPFKQIEVFGDLLLIGMNDQFYVYNLKICKLLLQLELNFYFGYIYIYKDRFIVCDACNVYCYNSVCELLWQTSDLGIDGVVINNLSDGIIYGEGEFDPPGGWIPFKIDFETGKTLL